MDGALLVLAVVTAVGCGLVGGVFFAFSSFVMPALKRLPPADGIAAMQSINVTAVTPLFMAALFGTAAAAPGPGGVGRRGGRERLAAAAAALYLVGVIGVTVRRQRAPERPPGDAAQPSDHGAVGRVPGALDRLEPRAHGRRSGGGDSVDRDPALVLRLHLAPADGGVGGRIRAALP